jgi:hypothetical protein
MLLLMFSCSGYMAPEYAMHGHFSIKSDVFSFGVLILEIVSGQKNSYFRIGENLEDLLSYVSMLNYLWVNLPFANNCGKINSDIMSCPCNSLAGMAKLEGRHIIKSYRSHLESYFNI